MAKRLMAASETEMVRKTRQNLKVMQVKRMALQARAEVILKNRKKGDEATMKMYRQEPTLKEWERMMEAHAKKVCESKEAAIQDLQAAGILDENGNLAERFKSDGLSELEQNAQKMCHQLGHKIMIARTEKQWSLEELATRAELPLHMIAQAEHGNISVSGLVKIALALGEDLNMGLVTPKL